MDAKKYLTSTSFWTFVAGFALGMLVILAVLFAKNIDSEVKTDIFRYTESQMRFMQNPVPPYQMTPNRDGTYNLRHSSGDYKVKPFGSGGFGVYSTPQGGLELYPTPQGGYELYPTPQGG